MQDGSPLSAQITGDTQRLAPAARYAAAAQRGLGNAVDGLGEPADGFVSPSSHCDRWWRENPWLLRNGGIQLDDWFSQFALS